MAAVAYLGARPPYRDAVDALNEVGLAVLDALALTLRRRRQSRRHLWTRQYETRRLWEREQERRQREEGVRPGRVLSVPGSGAEPQRDALDQTVEEYAAWPVPTRGYVFKCGCGASFGTRALDAMRATAQAQEHGWILHPSTGWWCGRCER